MNNKKLLQQIINAGSSVLLLVGCSVPAIFAQTPKPTVYYGVHVPGWLDNLDALTTFEDSAKKNVSIVMLYQGWGVPVTETDSTRYFRTSWMNNVRSHGSIPMVTWEPWLYTAGVDQPEYALTNIIHGKFDDYVKKWAGDSKSWGHPYFLRFAAEMNGYWFPWSERVNGNQDGEYVEAWRHVHDIFTSEGVTTVTWVWSPNVEYDDSSAALEGLYPGDDYVDWLGMDGYNWGTVKSDHVWQTFSEVFTQTYNHIITLSTKPLMVAETACAEQGGSKADWITDAYSTQIPNNFEKIKAVIWFNEDKTMYGETDWRIESSDSAQNAFAAAIQDSFYATNQYASLSNSPIPIPPDVINKVEENRIEIPTEYYLSQNYPNPFNPATKISYSIPRSNFVTLKVYDILGREIQILVSEFQKASIYFVNFDGSKLPNGIYFYRLQVRNDVETKKMLLIQ